MSQTLSNMIENTLSKVKEMISVNDVVGSPITTPEGVTIIPISKVSVGFGGGGSDFVSKNPNKQSNPFGGGVGGGVHVTPLAFIVIKGDSVRMLPVALPANTTTERVVELVPDVLDKLTDFIDSRLEKK